MIQVRRGTRRSMRRPDRHSYADLPRRPIRIISWATDSANIGGIIRSAEAYLADRVWGLKRPGPTAVATDRWQPYDHTSDLASVLLQCRLDGYTIVALEQTDESDYLGPMCRLPRRMCLLVGNEGSGLPQSALDQADQAIEIEQYGLVGSLNVVTATGIALYEWDQQRKELGWDD